MLSPETPAVTRTVWSFVWMSLENQMEFVKIAVASSQSLIKPRNLKEINMS